jgi:hypothetical protein
MEQLLFTMIGRIPAAGVADFQRYEDEVLPTLAEHGGRLERRLRTADASVEVHIVSFPSEIAFEAFRLDPRRTAAQPWLERSGAQVELLAVDDVAAD